MKAELVLDIEHHLGQPSDASIFLDRYIEEYQKYKDVDTSKFIERCKRAYSIIINNEEYNKDELDGDFPLGNPYEAEFAVKYFDIEDIVKLQLKKFKEVNLCKYEDSYNDIRKGIIFELKKDYMNAFDIYTKINDNNIYQRGLFLRNKMDLINLEKELQNHNFKYLNKLEEERITSDVKNFWTVCLETGYKEEENKKLMHKFQLGWHELAAKYGDPYSMYVLAIAFVRGYPYPQNRDLAYYYARKGDENKNYMATFIKGMLRESGFGCQKDVKKAISLYEKASEHGVMGAMLRLNLIYKEGKDGIKPNEKKANDFIFLD